MTYFVASHWGAHRMNLKNYDQNQRNSSYDERRFYFEFYGTIFKVGDYGEPGKLFTKILDG